MRRETAGGPLASQETVGQKPKTTQEKYVVKTLSSHVWARDAYISTFFDRVRGAGGLPVELSTQASTMIFLVDE